MGRFQQIMARLLVAVAVAVSAWAAQEVIDLADDLETRPCADYHPGCRRWQGLKMCEDSMYAGYMRKTCFGSCATSCRSLGEGNGTKVNEDPAMVQLDKEIKVAQQSLSGASDWASKLQKAQNLGCPCPGRDFHPEKPGAAAPAKEKQMDTGNSTEADEGDPFVGASVEEVNALVEHYVKKYAEGQSSWTNQNEKQLHKAGKDLDKAGVVAQQKLHDARGDFERMVKDPKFASWFKDMCPCKGDKGYEEMMTRYHEVATDPKGDHAKANWHIAVLEKHRRDQAKKAEIVAAMMKEKKAAAAPAPPSLE